ncbi:MAG: AfsR/SARP family transcriptional regulator [Actinomyces sp.]|nr:MAG: AfsR/SARP family transcriptional regulator [Actinomyces sp.]
MRSVTPSTTPSTPCPTPWTTLSTRSPTSSAVTAATAIRTATPAATTEATTTVASSVASSAADVALVTPLPPSPRGRYSRMAVRVRVLGDLAVDGEPIQSARVRCLLARLAVSPGEIVAEEALIEALWPGDPPRSARTALHTHVGALRDLLEPDRARRSDGSFLFRRQGGYLLELGDALDASLLRHNVTRAESARTHRPQSARDLLDEALALWTRPAFAEFGAEHWALAAAATAAEYALRAVTLRSEICLELGDAGSTVAPLEEALADHPYDERVAALLVEALHASGRKADALDAYQATRRRLVEDLGVEPGPSLRAAERAVLEDRRPRAATRPPPSQEPTSFVGRVEAEAELRRLLRDHRFVTVVGPGGVGKTRLAARVAAALAGDWGRTLTRIDLATVSGGGVMAAVVEGSGGELHPRIDPRELLTATAGREGRVILFDTCEHRADELRDVLDLLLEVPGITVLATSRRPIGHRAELCFELEPLSTDDATLLLLDRAGLEFDDETERKALGEICRRLDGLPLAIELAAGRLRTISPTQLSELLRRGTARLRGSDDRPLRHRSLHETIEWSYRLLDDDARCALRRLAVFRGRFTDQMALEVLEGLSDPAAVLAALVERSLVARVDGVTLELLDTVREFAWAKAGEVGEQAELGERHARWVAGAVVAHVGGGGTVDPDDLVAEIGPALDHLHDTDPGTELLVTGMLGLWWVETSKLAEGRARLEGSLAAIGDRDDLVVHLAEMLAGLLAWYHGDGHDAVRFLRRALVGLDPADDEVLAACGRAGLAFAEGKIDAAATLADRLLDPPPDPGHPLASLVWFSAANIALYAGRHADARERYRALERLAGRHDDAATVARARRFLAFATTLGGESERSWALAEHGLALASESGDLTGLAQAHAIVAHAALAAGDSEVAAVGVGSSLAAVLGNHDSFSLRLALPVAAVVALEQGRIETAIAVLGWLRHFLEDRGLFLVPEIQNDVDAALRRVGTTTSRVALTRGLARAAGLSLRDLVELVRES